MDKYQKAFIDEFRNGNLISKSQFLQKAIHLQSWYENIVEGGLIKKNLTKYSHSTEIVFHGPGKLHVRSAKSSNIVTYDIPEVDFQCLFDFFCHFNHINNNKQNPFTSCHLKIGNEQYRVSLLNNIVNAKKYPKMFFRKIEIDLPQYSDFDINESLALDLAQLISSKKNILISGATHSGKTTLLRKLISEIPSDQHLIILEDTHEIISSEPFHTHLLSSSENRYREFCKYILRMTPERILFGELRGGEALDIILALNSGQKGFLTTIHATSASNSIHRLCQLVQIFHPHLQQSYSHLLKLFTQNIDYVIHLESFKIKEIIKVIGSDQQQCLFEKIFPGHKHENTFKSYLAS